MNIRSVRTIVLLWLAWAVVMTAYMQLVPYRYAPSRPDNALTWTANETRRNSNDGKIYLLEPFLNAQVAWDSEYYLSIATVGYEDPALPIVNGHGDVPVVRSYAFFPLYPMAMKVVRVPFELFGMTPIAASTAAGLLISLGGTLAGMLGLYSLSRSYLGEDGGVRTAWMLLIFPTSMFFAVVYTEGLFVGLAFCSLALMQRQRLAAAAVLAALATLTRSVGGVLVVPLALAWLGMLRSAPLAERRAIWLRLPLLALPLAAYGLHRLTLGPQFDLVENVYFGNGLLQISRTLDAWGQLLAHASQHPETVVHIVLSVAALALALLSCVLNLRRYPGLALFGLLAIAVPLVSGWTGTASTIRYTMVAPTLWIMLAGWGRRPSFERIWTLVSVLLLAMMGFLFAWDYWVS